MNSEHISTLLPETRAALGKDDAARIYHIREEKWIPYPHAESILAKLEELLTSPPKSRMESILITGDSNNGKSSLAQEFLRRHPATDGIHSDAQPVVWIDAPPTPDEGRLYDKILKHFLVPYKYKDTPSKKEHEVKYYLKELGTRMLILDEIHSILAGPITKQKVFMNALKSLNNSLYIPIVLMGIESARRAVGTDEQIISRFPPTTLPKWQLNPDYASLLASIESTLPLKKESALASVDLAPKILDLSEGCIGDIIKLIGMAAVMAIRTGSEKIRAKELNECGFIRPSKRRTDTEGDVLMGSPVLMS